MGAIATVHEKFTAQALSPIILNLFMAGAAYRAQHPTSLVLKTP